MTRILTKSVELNKNIIAKDLELANQVRTQFNKFNIKAYDILGTIGAGKTTLLERIAQNFASKVPMLVINGDLATNIDADRIGKFGATTIQINTGRGCHLDARWIHKTISDLPNGLEPFLNGLVFIENVGNLICPSAWDVGAHQRVVVTSVTEGPYHIKKHPIIFKIASIAIINKIELAGVMEVELEQLKNDAIMLNKEIRVLFTSLKKKPYKGLDSVYNALKITV
ncbi:MAG: hydrogenase nickel incorporation protein HypB [Candidatus Hodarchaeales archaeon]|jgi:hydrogenase nickel incorporation protein HypB